MIIDFHTHTFPNELAQKAILKLSRSANISSVLNGTADELSRSAAEAGIDLSILLPVATKPEQTKKINLLAFETVETYTHTGLLSFGAIHPDNENYREIIKDLSAHHIQGIKLHPVFQKTYFDDIRYLHIIDCACEYDMIIVTHAGYDISSTTKDYVTPEHITAVLDKLSPEKLVLAHMGGWNCYDEVYDMICQKNVYLDTSFCLIDNLSMEFFKKMVKKHGADRILFGTDSPWCSQSETLDKIKKSGLSQNEIRQILGENAAGLLNLYLC